MLSVQLPSSLLLLTRLLSGEEAVPSRSLLLLSWPESQDEEIKVSEVLVQSEGEEEREREKKQKLVTKSFPSSCTFQVDTFKKVAARCDRAGLSCQCLPGGKPEAGLIYIVR